MPGIYQQSETNVSFNNNFNLIYLTFFNLPRPATAATATATATA